MPLLTFVLAVHGDQAYIGGCAESLLGPDFADVELVAIDDASPDHAPRLLDELAARDDRVTRRAPRGARRTGRGAQPRRSSSRAATTSGSSKRRTCARRSASTRWRAR